MKKKIVPVEKSIGLTLMHDITKIIPGRLKEVIFKRGHIVKQTDIENLKNCGKEKIYILKMAENDVHENDASNIIAQNIHDKNIYITETKEGRTNLCSSVNGLLEINKNLINKINQHNNILVSTLQNNLPVKKNNIVAAVKTIPLVIKQKVINSTLNFLNKSKNSKITVKEYKIKKAALIVTGNEIKKGRISDDFYPILTKKLLPFDCQIINHIIVEDNKNLIAEKIKQFSKVAQLIIITGGMSVDPDDVTASAIKIAGCKTIVYGMPVLPGAMFMLATCNDKPVMGVPACGMYAKTTVFDIILAQILIGELPTRKFLRSLGYGGLCRRCSACFFPNCGFGKS